MGDIASKNKDLFSNVVCHMDALEFETGKKVVSILTDLISSSKNDFKRVFVNDQTIIT